MNINEQMTWAYLKSAYRDCDFCKAHWRCQEVQQFSEAMGDGLLFCTHCYSYLGVWDRVEGQVSRKAKMLAV